MAKITGGFLVPHDPVMFVAPNAPEEKIAKKVWGAYEECAQRLADSGATTVIIIGNDHYMLFGTTCLPQYCIATGRVDGPLDQLPGLNRIEINNNEDLARHIAEHGKKDGFDWAVARSFTTDHAFSIPYKLIVQRAEEISGRTISAVPVYLASGVDPFISLQRARELGEQIQKAVESFSSKEEVYVIGSGGISHWVGLKETGKVNEEFDREIIRLCCTGDLDTLVSYSNSKILEEGGNGAMEIRNFVCAIASLNYSSGHLIEYQPVSEWVTGLGFIELKSA